MFYSIAQGQGQFLKFIVNNLGVDLNARDIKGHSILHLAVQKGDMEAASFLADENMSTCGLYSGYFGNTNLRDNQHQSPLHVAAKYGHHEILQMLLTKSFIFDGYYDCLRAVKMAVLGKHHKVVQLLLDECINIEFDNRILSILFYVAPFVGIVSGGIISVQDHPLIEDALNAGLVVFDILLIQSLSQSSMLKGKMHFIQNLTFISIAATVYGMESIFDILPDMLRVLIHYVFVSYALGTVLVEMEKGERAWINILNKAIQLDYNDMVQFLLDRGVNVLKSDSDGRYPIYLAEDLKDIKVLSMFFERGANLPNSSKKLLVDNAIEENKIEILSNLISDIHMYEYSIYYAAKLGQVAVLNFLLDYDDSSDHLGMALCCAVYHGHLEAVKVLISAGASTEFCDDQDRTPLYIASERGFIEIVKLLLDSGAVFDSDQYSVKVLFISILKGHDKVAKELIKQNVNIQSEDGNTALHCAVVYKRVEILDFLINKGDLVNTKNNQGHNALDLSLYGSNFIISLKLIAAGSDISLALLNKILSNLEHFYLEAQKLDPIEYGSAFFNILTALFKIEYGMFEGLKDKWEDYLAANPDECNNLINNLIAKLLSINYPQEEYTKQKFYDFNKVSKVLNAIANFNNVSNIDYIDKVTYDKLESFARYASNCLSPLVYLCIKNQPKQKAALAVKVEDVFLKDKIISYLPTTEQIKLTEVSKGFLDDLFIVNTGAIGKDSIEQDC